MSLIAGSATRHLSTARLELATTRRLRNGLHLSVVAALVVLSAVFALRGYPDGGVPTSRVSEIETRNKALDAELARVRTELALERATRSSLQLQVATLNERIAELRSQIDFVNSQRGHPRATQ
jgi:uncharacterized small protein (DUF1192 family)